MTERWTRVSEQSFNVLSVILSATATGLLLIAILLTWRQLRKANQHLHVQALRDRVDLYFASEAPIGEAEERLLSLHVADFFDPAVYTSRYENDREATAKYLLMHRRYIFLLYCLMAEDCFKSPFGIDLGRWVETLGREQAFRDVHASQSKYYDQKFKDFIDARLPQSVSTELSALNSSPFDRLS